MKLSVKKTYCSNCRGLVRGQERKNNDHLELVCPRCNRVLWTRNDLGWSYTAEAPK